MGTIFHKRAPTIRLDRFPITRQTWVVAHRWAGLTIALFLIVAGFTGALLPWNEELSRASRPSLSAATPPYPGARPLDPITLAQRVGRNTGATISDIDFDVSATRVARFYLSPPPGSTQYQVAWADPYTGAIRLRWRDGMLADGPQAIMSFVYRLHYELALGATGRTMLGIAALVWTIDCFVGFYLTLPIRRRRLPGPKPATATGWWHRWRPAWLVRRTGGRHKLTFDLHRAGGLWVWPVLLVFAWSSVAFNLPQVAVPVMRAFGATERYYPPPVAQAVATPPIDMPAAVGRGRALLGEIGRRDGFVPGASLWLRYMPERAAYGFAAGGGSRLIDKGGLRWVYFSAVDGRLLGYQPPIPPGRADALMAWLVAFHMADVLGLPYRIFVSLLGMLVVALSVTGILIWMKKRAARLLAETRAERTGFAIPLPAE